MAAVMNECPKCAKDVPIGFETSEASFDANFPRSGTFKCPHCDTIQPWLKQNLWIQTSASHAARSVLFQPLLTPSRRPSWG